MSHWRVTAKFTSNSNLYERELGLQIRVDHNHRVMVRPLDRRGDAYATDWREATAAERLQLKFQGMIESNE